ncbi:hypothetical protein D3C85_1321840 [compost metagenome]
MEQHIANPADIGPETIGQGAERQHYTIHFKQMLSIRGHTLNLAHRGKQFVDQVDDLRVSTFVLFGKSWQPIRQGHERQVIFEEAGDTFITT